jgi:hypothetical protein
MPAIGRCSGQPGIGLEHIQPSVQGPPSSGYCKSQPQIPSAYSHRIPPSHAGGTLASSRAAANVGGHAAGLASPHRPIEPERNQAAPPPRIDEHEAVVAHSGTAASP